jgi:hypothetical protein
LVVGKKIRALRTHVVPDRPSLIILPGDEVEIGERSLEWPAFVFVTAELGEGWVPERHFTSDRARAVAVTRYDTVELAVDQGDVLTVVERDDESGWWWCQSDSGEVGWVPVGILDIE